LHNIIVHSNVIWLHLWLGVYVRVIVLLCIFYFN
jgi:hypothetical protein